MNLTLFILSIIVLSVFIINRIIYLNRTKHITNMSLAYSKMETYLVENNIILNNDKLRFMTIFKNLIINPDFLDIQILLLTKIAVEKSGNLKNNSIWFNDILTNLGPDFEMHFKEFDKSADKLVKLSIYKPDFLYFLCKQIIKNTLSNGVRAFDKMRKEFKFIQDNDEVLSYTSMNLKPC